MRYLGGKCRTRKQIATFLESVRKQEQVYFEPFVGGAWVLQEITGKRIASDACYPLIAMYKEMQSGWMPPMDLSQSEYNRLKYETDPYDFMRAFAGFGCSFSGKWFGGFARSGIRNYCANASSSLIRQAPLLSSVDFRYGGYDDHQPVGHLVYCDPPYSGTTSYGAVPEFDHVAFWEKMRLWSKYNTVVISEYQAPDDFQCVLEIQTKTDMRTKTGQQPRIEKLFMAKE